MVRGEIGNESHSFFYAKVFRNSSKIDQYLLLPLYLISKALIQHIQQVFNTCFLHWWPTDVCKNQSFAY